MKFQIKSLSGQLSEDEKKLIRKKLLWLEEHLANNAELTVGVRQHITKKSNQAYEVVLHLFIPQTKKPIYTKVFRNSLLEALDISKEKIERVVVRQKEKGKGKFHLSVPRISLFRKAK